MNNICALCGHPLTAMDTLLGENKLADGQILCNKCLNQATGINKSVADNLAQLFLPEIRGIILEGKMGISESQSHSSDPGFQRNDTHGFGFAGKVTRFDDIQDQIVALNARLSIFANAEVKELVHVLENDERLTAIAEGLTMPGKIEGLIFSTQKRVVFMDKKILGNVQKDEYLYQNIRSASHTESLLYSTLKIFTKNGSVAEFRLHNKNDGRNFCDAVNQYVNACTQQASPTDREIQPSSYNMDNLRVSESPFKQNLPHVHKESPEVIFAQLDKLGILRDRGVLTEQEFADQKKKLLDRL